MKKAIIVIVVGIFLVSLSYMTEYTEDFVNDNKIPEDILKIAINDCGEENITSDFMYNNITKTWWIETTIEKQGCLPACVVSEETQTAEINWRCTGLMV